MSFTERSSYVLDARFLVVDDADPLAGFPLRAPDGSLAAPSYAFEQNVGTGMALVSDNLTFGVNGAASVAVSMEGNVSVAGGVPTDYGGTTPGEGVLLVHEATTAPTSVSGGGMLYVSGTSLNFLDTNGAVVPLSSKTGDVTGPGASTQNAIASFNGATGKIIQNSFLIGTTAATLQSPDGTAADNVYTFTGDTNTGLFYASSALQFGSGGAGRFLVGASSVSTFTSIVTLLPDGSIGAPSYSFSAATSSGVFLNGIDVHLVSNGANSLVVDDVGAAVPNTSLSSAPPSNYGVTTPGVGVVFIPEATTVPVGVPNNGAGTVLYVTGDDLFTLNSSGVARDVTKCIEETSGTTVLDSIVTFSGTTGKIVQDNSTASINSDGQWILNVGTGSSASYGFLSSPATGIIRGGVGTVAVNGGANTVFLATSSLITTTEVIQTPDGTVAAPTHGFVGATGSGMFLDSTGSLTLTASGTSGLFMHDDHNVGVCGVPANTFGGGTGVLWMRGVSTAPSSNPTAGVLLYVDGAELVVRNPSGDVITLTDEVTGPGSATDEALAIFSGTGGATIQNSLVTGTDAGQLRAADGTSANPAYGFTSDPDSGLYISGTDVLLSAGAGDQLMVDGAVVQTSVPFAFPAGTQSLPGLTFTSDPNTGIYRPGGDQLAMTVGGTSGWLASIGTSAGNVGLTGGSSFGGGDGVVYIEEAAVVPVGTLTSGGILYVNGNDFVFHDDAGTATTLNSSATQHITGPTTSGLNQVVYYTATGGDVVDAATSVTTTATQLSATQYRQSADVAISNDTNRLAFTMESGNSMFVGSGGVEVTGVPLHVDADLRVSGASGVLESFAGSTHTTNHLNAVGTYEWQQNGTTIFTTDASRNLVTANSVVFPDSTETLTIGNTAATKYTIASTSTATPDQITFSVDGTTRINTTTSHPTLTNALEFPTQTLQRNGSSLLATSDGTAAAPAFELSDVPGTGLFYDAATASVCMSADGDMGLAIAQGATDTNVALGVASPPTTYNGGDRVIYIGEAIAEPTINASSSAAWYVTSDDDMRYDPAVTVTGSWANLNGVARRARITLSGYSVADATSDDLDGETWTDVDSSGISGTTTGALSIISTDVTVMVIAEATWSSNATGYRRVSITTGAGHTVEATATDAAVSGVDTVQRVTLMRRLSSSEASLQFAAQVFQNSTAALNVDVVMTLIRLN